MADLSYRVPFLLQCTDFPTASPEYAGLRLGIQAKKEVIEDLPLQAGDRLFEFVVDVSLPEENGAPFYKGDVVQGKRGDQFIYLCWGERKEGEWVLHSRAKVPLNAIPGPLIKQAAAENRVVRAVIQMTDDRGNPAAASLREDRVSWSLA